MIPCYLTAREVMALLGLPKKEVYRLLMFGRLATLEVGPQIRRIESASILAGAPAVLPPGPSSLNAKGIATLMRMHHFTVGPLCAAGLIPMRRSGAEWAITRRELWHFVQANTHGDERDPAEFQVNPDALAALRLQWAAPLLADQPPDFHFA